MYVLAQNQTTRSTRYQSPLTPPPLFPNPSTSPLRLPFLTLSLSFAPPVSLSLHCKQTDARTHACMHARTHVRTHARTHALTHAHTHARTHTQKVVFDQFEETLHPPPPPPPPPPKKTNKKQTNRQTKNKQTKKQKTPKHVYEQRTV